DIESKEIIGVLEKRQPKSSLRGMVAYKEKAVGLVRVIRHDKFDLANELEELKAGEILVTEMTRPQVVPYLKKVAGIVTDEGGVLCHAAIISREMKISCIVGTRDATVVLKTGDRVELDPDTGIVKIL
ncbi:MAG: phosphoenolpyruvate synthase, partial [Candidatus Diapherotrites archaeon]|nr:phosphoenolpyruvate synthase [Candidatus Diapherotrites archaeon]